MNEFAVARGKAMVGFVLSFLGLIVGNHYPIMAVIMIVGGCWVIIKSIQDLDNDLNRDGKKDEY